MLHALKHHTVHCPSAKPFCITRDAPPLHFHRYGARSMRSTSRAAPQAADVGHAKAALRGIRGSSPAGYYHHCVSENPPPVKRGWLGLAAAGASGLAPPVRSRSICSRRLCSKYLRFISFSSRTSRSISYLYSLT